MKKCEAKSVRETTCVLPIGDHYAHMDVEDQTWPNVEVQQRYGSSKGSGLPQARSMAKRTKRLTRTQIVEANLERNKDKVFDFLSNNIGTWIDASSIMSPAIGGQAGVMWINKLREEGYVIRARRHPSLNHTSFQYCFTGEKNG